MQETRASLILHNGQVISAGPSTGSQSLLAIRDGKVLGVGVESDLQSFLSPSTRVIDCDGGAIAPGFIDAHFHLFAYAVNLLSVDCSPRSVTSIGDVLSAVARYASQQPPGSWVRGWGIEEFHLRERRLPSRRELDSAAPKHPVKLVHRSGHASIMNSAALGLLEISEDTPEPPGGMMERDVRTGELTGYFLEMEDFLDTRSQASWTDTDLLHGLSLAEQQLLSLGITSIHEATPSRAMSRWETLRRLKDRQGFKVRVYNMFGPDDLDKLARAEMPFLSGNDALRVGAIKIMLNETGSEVLPPTNELDDLVDEAIAQGFQVAFHAVEEPAITAAVTAVERATKRIADWRGPTGNGTPPRPMRHRIEHAGLCSYAVRRRLASLGMYVVTQPAFVREHGDRYQAQVAAKDVDALYPIASMRREGVEVAFGSDCPVVPPDPFIGLKGAVTRLSRGGKAIGPAEQVSAMEAWWMYTRAAAFASFDEGRKGRIAPGYLADLTVLSRNPWTAPPDTLEDITVQRTILNGEVVWERG